MTEPDVEGSLASLANVALRVKGERDMLFSALKAMVRRCSGCNGTGETVSWSMDGPPFVTCQECKPAREALRNAAGGMRNE